jgi:uncharacterized protein
MALLCNLRHIEEKNLHLKGELPTEDLDIGTLDELIHVPEPLSYDVEVQQLEHALLIHGVLTLPLHCECVRCLKPFQQTLRLPHWACHLPLEGEDKVELNGDCVDLTPYIREDIVLAFPQHPLCRPDCSGLASLQKKPEESPGSAAQAAPDTSAWAALDKLKL